MNPIIILFSQWYDLETMYVGTYKLTCSYSSSTERLMTSNFSLL